MRNIDHADAGCPGRCNRAAPAIEQFNFQALQVRQRANLSQADSFHLEISAHVAPTEEEGVYPLTRGGDPFYVDETLCGFDHAPDLDAVLRIPLDLGNDAISLLNF